MDTRERSKPVPPVGTDFAIFQWIPDGVRGARGSDRPGMGRGVRPRTIQRPKLKENLIVKIASEVPAEKGIETIGVIPTVRLKIKPTPRSAMPPVSDTLTSVPAISVETRWYNTERPKNGTTIISPLWVAMTPMLPPP